MKQLYVIFLSSYRELGLKSYESINSFFGKMEEKTVKRRCGADVLLFSHWFNCLYCRQGGRVASALDLYSTGCMGSINSRSHHWLALFFGSAKFNPWATLLNIEPDRLQLLVVASSKNREVDDLLFNSWQLKRADPWAISIVISINQAHFAYIRCKKKNNRIMRAFFILP